MVERQIADSEVVQSKAAYDGIKFSSLGKSLGLPDEEINALLADTLLLGLSPEDEQLRAKVVGRQNAILEKLNGLLEDERKQISLTAIVAVRL